MEHTPILPNSREEKRLLKCCMALTGILLILDQVSKAAIEKYVSETIVVVPGFFNIVHVGNPGAAWGIFAGHRWPLLAISIGFFLFVVFYFRKLTEGWPERYYALVLVISGIFGNSVDRIWRGGIVVDFLDFNFPDIKIPAFEFLFIKFPGYFMDRWPAFNVADSAICIGVGLYMISSFKRPEEAAGKPSQQGKSEGEKVAGSEAGASK